MQDLLERCKKIEVFLVDIRSRLELSSSSDELKQKIDDYCEILRNEIDINTESQVFEFDVLRTSMINRIDDYEKQCLVNANTDNFDSFIEQAKEDLKKIEQSGDRNEVVKLSFRIEQKIKQVDSLIFTNEKLAYKESITELSSFAKLVNQDYFRLSQLSHIIPRVFTAANRMDKLKPKSMSRVEIAEFDDGKSVVVAYNDTSDPQYSFTIRPFQFQKFQKKLIERKKKTNNRTSFNDEYTDDEFGDKRYRYSMVGYSDHYGVEYEDFFPKKMSKVKGEKIVLTNQFAKHDAVTTIRSSLKGKAMTFSQCTIVAFRESHKQNTTVLEKYDRLMKPQTRIATDHTVKSLHTHNNKIYAVSSQPPYIHVYNESLVKLCAFGHFSSSCSFGYMGHPDKTSKFSFKDDCIFIYNHNSIYVFNEKTFTIETTIELADDKKFDYFQALSRNRFLFASNLEKLVAIYDSGGVCIEKVVINDVKCISKFHFTNNNQLLVVDPNLMKLYVYYLR